MLASIFNNVEVMSNYGFMAVVATLFIYIFYNQNKMMTKNFNKLFDNVMENLNKIVKNNETTNVTALKEIESEKEKAHNDKLSLRMQISPSINTTLKEICLKYRAQRCYIIEFHNTNSNFNGIPFAKYSVTFEHVTIGVRPIMPFHTNIGFSAIANVAHTILCNGHEVIANNKEFQEKCPLIKGMGNMSRTQAMVCLGLFDHQNNLFGMLVLEYHTELTQAINDKKQHKKYMSDLTHEALQVSTLLNLTPYAECK